MNQKACRFPLPATFVVMMVALFSIFIFAGAQPAFAAAGTKKPAAVARTSAVDHTETRIKQLQGALQITEKQQELWNSLTQVMRENAIELDSLSKDKSEITKTMNAVEAMKFHNQITESRLGQQNKLIPAFEALYVAMSDDQKKITDVIFRTGKHGKRQLN